jgi:hypothetical protein
LVVSVPATIRTSACRGLAREERPEAVHPDQVEDVVGLGGDDLEDAAPARIVAPPGAARLVFAQVGDIAGLAAVVRGRVGCLPKRIRDDDRRQDVAAVVGGR